MPRQASTQTETSAPPPDPVAQIPGRSDEPVRWPDPPQDMESEVVESVNLSLALIASVFGLHPSCPRRACRDGCRAAGRTCRAEFPRDVEKLLAVMHWYSVMLPADILSLWREDEEA